MNDINLQSSCATAVADYPVVRSRNFILIILKSIAWPFGPFGPFGPPALDLVDEISRRIRSRTNDPLARVRLVRRIAAVMQ